MKFKHVILAIIFTFFIAGCAQYGAIKKTVASAAQEGADEALEVVLWQLCRASSIGAINRWIKGDEDLADAYNTICNRDKQANVVATDE